jgi:hypothetical protein
MKYLLVIALFVWGCESKKTVPPITIGNGLTVTKPYDYFEAIIKPIQDSLQRDNIAMDNFGKENLNSDQVCTYNRNCYITIVLNDIKLKSLELK